jgi:2-keto-3-deoxy-L-rhamnonate aldolase RhmA
LTPIEARIRIEAIMSSALRDAFAKQLTETCGVEGVTIVFEGPPDLPAPIGPLTERQQEWLRLMGCRGR